MRLLLTKAAAFGLFFTADRLAPTCGSTVTVTELNEDPGCEGRTTAMYATITPGSCADNGKYDVCTVVCLLLPRGRVRWGAQER
ncbi:hypothetical protein PR003_g33065 [Phytophthora rubi]|uniref:Uncharacterized protein n=1 Tax=Phytophthora rubi TaxID=129364 RepID=A0A6A4B0Q1_9STRA|nr:hypothetical protein PR002_g31702 [Phytophthora rubi]KAE8956006.1 hypothetical protein PR001_g31888 [Phytophthora rubi]KAE9263690.1 hypothetical protein PR003_g33065 [Phytophthora rubi]